MITSSPVWFSMVFFGPFSTCFLRSGKSGLFLFGLGGCEMQIDVEKVWCTVRWVVRRFFRRFGFMGEPCFEFSPVGFLQSFYDTPGELPRQHKISYCRVCSLGNRLTFPTNKAPPLSTFHHSEPCIQPGMTSVPDH